MDFWVCFYFPWYNYKAKAASPLTNNVNHGELNAYQIVAVSSAAADEGNSFGAGTLKGFLLPLQGFYEVNRQFDIHPVN